MKKAKNFPRNKYKGKCDQCSALVEAEKGRLMAYQKNDNGTFRYWVRHDDCFFKKELVDAELPGGEG